jgi:hypothetical protein
LSFGVVVNDNQTLPAGSVASNFTYDSKTCNYVEVEEGRSTMFEEGDIAYLPRECQLRSDELIGSSKLYLNEEESDFEDQDDED